MTKTIGDYLFITLSIIGSLASTFAYIHFIGPQLNDQGAYGVIFIGFFALVFFCYSLYLISKYRKRVRYAEAFENINIAFAEIHKLHVDKDTVDATNTILVALINVCNNLSDTFSKINGHQISVCIKHLEFENKHALVTTLVRDVKSKANNRKTGTADKTKHWLSSNSDFNFIYSHFDDDSVDTNAFFETKLPIREDYINSRLKNWPPKKMIVGNRILRRNQWPLKYRSTVVVPIVPLMADDQSKKALRGFLCIDSPRESSFYKDVDVNILRGVADGLYKKIDIINEIMNQ